MPIYEYYCEKCNRKFSRLVDIDADISECPFCSQNTKKVPSVCNNATFKPTDEGETSRVTVMERLKKYNDSEQADKTGKVKIY